MYTSQIIIQQYNYTHNLNTYDTKLTAVCSQVSPFCQLVTKFYVNLLTYLKPLMNEITVDHQYICVLFISENHYKETGILEIKTLATYRF